MERLPDILLSEDGARMSYADEEVRALLDAGVVYVCDKAGECGFEHWGGAFLHYCEGKGHDEEQDVIYGGMPESGPFAA